MAETDVENTDPNPFLAALKAYKKTNGAPPVQPQRTGSVNPFADLVVKKKSEISAPGSQNGLQESPNGSAASPSSPDNSIDNTPGFRKPNIVPTSTDVGVPFDQAHKIISNMPNEGSYSNLPQHLANKLTSTVSNGLAGLAGIVRNQTPNGNLPLYDKDGNISDYGQSVDHDASTDPIGRFILTLNGATKAENQQNTANPLPQTVMGKITGGTIDVAPDIATTALMPEAEAPEVLSALSKLKSAIWNPFTKVLTGKGFINSVNEGAQRGETSDEQLKSGAIGAGNGFVNGGTMGLLGGIAGAVSEPIFKGMDKIGLVSAGNSALTKSGVKAVADANLFAALPLVTAGGEHIYNKLMGAKDDPNLWKNAKEEAQTGFGMGLGFGAMDVFHALGEDAHSKAQISEVHNDRQAVALQNFVTADPEAITQAFKNPTPTGDLNAQAVEYAHKAMQENDADKKQQLILVAQTLAKSSDVKGVTQAILSDKNGFLAHINQSDIPDAMKKQITDKVNLIHSQLDPVEQQKQALGQKINSIDQDIAQIQPQADNEPDIVKKTDAEVGIENLNKTRDEFIKELKGITVKQHEDMQKNSAPVDYTPVELPENKAPEPTPESRTVDQVDIPNYSEIPNVTQPTNNNSPLNKSENESTKSSEEAKQESSPQGSAENEFPAEKEVVNPDGDKKPSDTTELPVPNENETPVSETEKPVAEEKPVVAKKATTEESEPVKPKVKIDKYELIQPSHLKGTDYHLALGEFQDGKFGIIDTQTKNRISNLYDSKWEAINTYEKNREKLTPKVVDDYIAKTKKIEFPDEAPKAKIVPLSEKGKTAIDKDIEPHGITYDQIKDYEQSRSKPDAGLPKGDSKESGSVQEDVRPTDDKSGSTDKNIKGEGVREQPEKSAGAVKEEKIRKKIEDNKKEFMKAVRETRKKGYSNPLDPELIAKGVKLMASYAELGIHKFSEIAKDFISILGKDNFTDDDADALKAAYFAHVANLDPKERKSFDSLKDVDTFMGDGMKLLRGQEPKATIPTYTPKTEARLPIPKEDTPPEEEKALKKIYNKTSALKSYAVRNLEQLKAFAKDIKDFDALRAVRKYATSKSQSTIILKTATNKIVEQIGKAGWQLMREALVESRLRGVKQRWNSYADQAKEYTDSQIRGVFKDGEDGNMYDLVKSLKPLQGEQNPANFAVSLIASGRLDEARQYLSNVFKQAADNVLSLGPLSNGKTFDEIVHDGQFTDPKMQSALDTYKQFIEKPIAESHESNEGIFSDSLGDLDTYYPLTGENLDNKVRLAAKGKAYNTPNNINNRFASGQSDNYSTQISDLSDKLTSAIKVNNKANAMDALKKVGLISDVAHNAPETSKLQVDGDTWDMIKEKVGEGRTIIDGSGNIVNTKSRYVMMPTWLKKELDPIFNSTDDADSFNPVGKVMNVVTKVALGGPTEAVAHSYRMLGVITNSMPFMHEWAYKNGVMNKAGGYVANNPFVKKWTGLHKILTTDISSAKALQTIQEMSKLGIIPEKTWTKTWNKEFAELNGAKAMRIKIGKVDIPNVFDFSPALYGKRSIDLKARVLMYNLTNAMNPEATPEMHVKMQNELGVYTKSLQGTLERKIKESGIAPYYTFGTSIYRSALKSVTGTSPVPAEPGRQYATYKAAQLLTNGIIGTVASWALLHHGITGLWPWEDERSKLGRVPFPEFAKNDLTAKIWQDGNGDWKDLNLMAINNPVLERGLRVTGAEKAYETNQLGGTGGQSLEAGATQALNTFLSPFTSSPALQVASTAAFGSAPYMTALRDDKGRPAPQFFRKVKAVASGSQPLANIYAAAKGINPLIDKAVTGLNQEVPIDKTLFGLKSVTNPDLENEGASSLGFVLNMAFPRFFVRHGDDGAKAGYIQKEHDALDKTISKEQDAE